MSTFIRQIWQGDFAPGVSPTVNTPELRKLLALQERHRTALLNTLNPQQTEIFEKYEDAEKESDCLTAEDAFTEGIRFALRLMTEALG
ncbi:MAG: hypothetical protein IKY52_05830 [Clostridia bacterium]|nr:hypothetical protein [Clostridia bacterium]